MKLLAATLLALVCATSGAALAANKKAKAKDSTKKECSAADKKAGKCHSKAAVSAATASAASVRPGSMVPPSSRMPASTRETNIH